MLTTLKKNEGIPCRQFGKQMWLHHCWDWIELVSTWEEEKADFYDLLDLLQVFASGPSVLGPGLLTALPGKLPATWAPQAALSSGCLMQYNVS